MSGQLTENVRKWFYLRLDAFGAGQLTANIQFWRLRRRPVNREFPDIRRLRRRPVKEGPQIYSSKISSFSIRIGINCTLSELHAPAVQFDNVNTVKTLGPPGNNIARLFAVIIAAQPHAFLGVGFSMAFL